MPIPRKQKIIFVFPIHIFLGLIFSYEGIASLATESDAQKWIVQDEIDGQVILSRN
jgi:hypothetical protein